MFFEVQRKTLRDDDYLLEVTVRVSARKRDAPAVMQLAEAHEDDETEGDKVLSAVVDLLDGTFLTHDSLLDFRAATARRISTVKQFENFETMGEPVHGARFHRRAEVLESPLATNRNKGKKADNVFAGFEERLKRLPDDEKFGTAAPLVLLFGSYMRREPEVGDMDLTVLTIPNANHETRKMELNAARLPRGLFEELGSPKKEVLQFLRNRSRWLALHEFSEVLLMKGELAFKVVYCSQEFQPLVDRWRRNELSGKEFLTAADELRRDRRLSIGSGINNSAARSS